MFGEIGHRRLLAPGAVVNIETMKWPIVKIAQAQLMPTMARAAARAFGSARPVSSSSLCRTSVSGAACQARWSATITISAISAAISR